MILCKNKLLIAEWAEDVDLATNVEGSSAGEQWIVVEISQY